jgi:putative membrane protein
MPSDPAAGSGWRRLHPFTLFFAIGSRLYASRAFLFSALLALVVSRGRRATGGWQDWEHWLLVPLVGLLALELVRYFTLMYRLDAHEIVIAQGLFWKRERHIPYARVQNIELTQHAAHRLAGVAVVRLDTGTGAGAEGELSVLSLDAVTELRDAVRAGRREAGAAPGSDAAQPDVLVALGLRELALHGLLTARGTVVIGAIAGLLWQADLDGWGVRRYLPSAEGVLGGIAHATPRVLVEIGLLGLAAILIFRLLSAAWSVAKHFDFRLTSRGPELFQSYGLITRVGRTIPRARIQKLTVSDDPWMRLLGRATLTVDTAAFVPEKHKQQPHEGSHVLVPIVPAARVAPLVRDVHPTGATAAFDDLAALEWQRVDPRTFRRLVPVRLAAAALVGLVVRGPSGSWGWALAAGLAVAAFLVVRAWIAARSTAFAWSGETLLFRSGAWARHVSLVRASRVQVVSLIRSPFDRRWGMARVHVDTAGAAGGGHHVRIPWLTDAVAIALYSRLRQT